ncbi:MAG: GerMN domain-containing protein [Treponema sp.]|nr:GerMN domain-containing protein [Treponema sp.]
MVSQAGSREIDIRRYVEETLLGPVALDSTPLFPRSARLESLLYRDGVAYVNLSESAALPAAEGPGVFAALSVLYSGLRRNFSYIKDVRLFIAGNEAYSGKFRELLGAYADI